MDDIDRIIAGMSEAQKRAILYEPKPDFYGSYEVQCSPEDARALISTGIIGTMAFGFLLTETGLAVRARLLQGEG